MFTYLDAFATDAHFAEYLPDYANLDELKAHYMRGGLGDVKVKKFLLAVLEETLAPIRARRAEYQRDIAGVYDILKKGSEAAREVAAETLSDVRAAMKIKLFRRQGIDRVAGEAVRRQIKMANRTYIGKSISARKAYCGKYYL